MAQKVLCIRIYYSIYDFFKQECRTVNNNIKKGTDKIMKSRKHPIDYIPYIIFFIGALVLVARSFFSFCWSDESFYFSTTGRFFMGDSIFKHDWFPTQLSGVMLLPFYSLYLAIAKSTTGIILYFRLLYVLLELISCIITYKILSKNVSKPLSTLAGLIVLFYSHLNIATLSYYTFSFHFMLISMLLLVDYYRSRKKRKLIVSGIFFALCVLALPTMAVAYFLVIFAVMILILISKALHSAFEGRNRGIKGFLFYCSNRILDANPFRVILYSLLGIIIPAILFFAFLLSNVSIKDFIEAIPYVLSDEEHAMSLVYPFKKFFIGINQVYGYAAYAGYMMIIISAGFSVLFTFRRYKNERTITASNTSFNKSDDVFNIIRSILFAGDIILFAFYVFFSFPYTGYIQCALMLFCIPLFFLTENRNYSLFVFMIIGGLIMAMVYSYSSDGGFLYTLSMGHFIASIGGIAILSDFIKDISNVRTYRSLSVIAFIIVGISTLQTGYLRIVNVYRDAAINMLDTRIDKGPAAGLFTTKEHYEMYNDVYDTITEYCTSSAINKKEGNIFITKLLPFGYLCTDLKVGAPTTWRTTFNSERLKAYYEFNPDRYPDVILVLNEEYGSYLSCGDIEADPNPNANEFGGYLQEYLDSKEIEIIETNCGNVYYVR